MNIVSVKRHINKLYTTVYKTVKQEFLNVAKEIEQEIYDEVIALGFDGDLRDIDEAWIEEFFNAYNPVTKYVFSNEIDRKNSRLFESLVASRLVKEQCYRTAENLLIRQIKQYAIDLEDAIAMVVYEDTGVGKVKWVAEHDHRTCGDCKELDGEVYKLHEAPDKLHYQCRCYLIPFTE
jgi:SPP1 gp7 family putative phage head morphogenesis protein